MPDGTFRTFQFLETPLMHPEMAARYPYIRTYTGVAVGNTSIRLKMDQTPAGVHIMVTGLPEGDAFIDPVQMGNSVQHQAYWKKDLLHAAPAPAHACGYDQVNDLEAAAALSQGWMERAGEQRAGDCQFRTYRLALACTGEYANYFGATGSNKAPAIAAMATALNRVNGIFERDATLTMVLVANNDQLVFTNPSTDGYTNNDGYAMLDENMTKCDAVIGNANYDIGHVFSTGGGGVAYLNGPCGYYKAGGVTGLPAPLGDPFYIDYVAHEMGHQYGANHSQNNNCQRASGASVEPGSGITIMGYAGICSPNVDNNSIAMFGGYSLQEIHANITNGTSSTCPQTVSLVNAPPTVSAGSNYTIPKSTPFVLTAVGSDPDAGDELTYSWEQMDAQPSTQPPSPTSANGPNFRPWLPTTDPQRWFPRLSVVASGTNPSPNWEVLSSVGRTFKFRVTARDNAVGGGCNAHSDVTITVNGSAGPFVVTQPNTAVTWTAGSSRTVTWNVAGTASNPVNCTAVDILLSTDGGLTWPHVLAIAKPNNGSASVTLPMLATTSARIMVKANGNVFYDMSDQNFTIEMNDPDFILEMAEANVTACAPANGVFNVTVNGVVGFSSPVTLSAIGLPGGLTASFSPNPVSPGNTATLTVSGTGGVGLGSYPFTLHGAGGGKSHDVDLNLFVGGTPAQVVLSAPAPAATVDGGTPLEWNAAVGAQSYEVVIASDAGMNNVVESATGLSTTSYTPITATVPASTYYWRVRGTSTCGNGTWSTVRSFNTTSCVPVTVRIVTDRYGEETTWSILGDGGAVMASGGPYTRGPSNGSYPQPDVDLCLLPGCYTLNVFDSYGDGFCCSYGNGSIKVLDGDGDVLASVSSFGWEGTDDFCIEAPELSVALEAKVFLDGPYGNGGLMRDDLRTAGLLPTTEPYTDLGFTQVGGGGETCSAAVMATTGNNAIVDWIRLELRSATDPSVIVATRQALLQRDGDIVDVDGSSPVSFDNAPGNYYIAVRHRNHLGCMTANAVSMGTSATTVDFTLPGTSVYGTAARKVAGTTRVLWMGNAKLDQGLRYTGIGNDRDAILMVVGSNPTASVPGYRQEDCNMDGQVRYTGPQNDRDPILQNIEGNIPTQTRQEQLP